MQVVDFRDRENLGDRCHYIVGHTVKGNKPTINRQEGCAGVIISRLPIQENLARSKLSRRGR